MDSSFGPERAAFDEVFSQWKSLPTLETVSFPSGGLAPLYGPVYYANATIGLSYPVRSLGTVSFDDVTLSESLNLFDTVFFDETLGESRSLSIVADGPERIKSEEKLCSSRKRVREEVAGDGKICHNCRGRAVDYLPCTKCVLRFCKRCLRNRHGEDIELEREVHWVCPRCRGGCGPGCTTTCCNCGPCMKKQNLPPTGLIVGTARSHGFSNVHDYLIHLTTRESAAVIAHRKRGRGWTSIDSRSAGQMRPYWGKKKLRSGRLWVANELWGTKRNGEVYELKLQLARPHATWEIGRKSGKSLEFETEITVSPPVRATHPFVSVASPSFARVE